MKRKDRKELIKRLDKVPLSYFTVKELALLKRVQKHNGRGLTEEEIKTIQGITLAHEAGPDHN